MTPLALILHRLLAKLRPAIAQPWPTGNVLRGRGATVGGHPGGKYIGWGACTMSRDHRYTNASTCLTAGDVERAAWWVLSMTYEDGRAHLTHERDV